MARLHLHQIKPSANGAANLMMPHPSPLAKLFDRTVSQLPRLTRRATSTTGGNDITLPVALAVIIPVTAAIITFIYLHRRHIRRLRKEDLNDPHHSLDFGMDSNGVQSRKQTKKGGPEMSITDLGTEKRRDRGLSLDLDMDVGSPYVLPHGLHGSRESIHSMSRSVHGQYDPYHPATTFIPNDSTVSHSYQTSRRGADDSSSYTGSTGRGNDSMNQGLLKNAQRMSRSMPPTQPNSVISGSAAPEIRLPEEAYGIQQHGLPSKVQTERGGLAPAALSDSGDSHTMKDGADLPKNDSYLGALIHSRQASVDHVALSADLPKKDSTPVEMSAGTRRSPPPLSNLTAQSSRPPRLEFMQTATAPLPQGNFDMDFDTFKVTPPSPTPKQPQLDTSYFPKDSAVPVPADASYGNLAAFDPNYDVRRLSMGFRPLPIEDLTDNPEQRANRIRSFYKEYFDESKPRPAADYYEDYDQGYSGNGSVFDQRTGQHAGPRAPFAAPVSRRAMTPPPRGASRFNGAANPDSATAGGPLRAPKPRAFSSASGQRGPPKKYLPPPRPLRILPTPHMLTEDSFALPIDFAPPSSYKDRQAGRPESPKGGIRPYSPMLPAHTPLTSSFDDLSVMPSPHLLRNSKTFTALDFAAPPRFRTADTASDAGSVRSSRSAMSASQLHAIRAGAYRVSRIPKEVVGTRDEFTESLRPSWGMRSHNA